MTAKLLAAIAMIGVTILPQASSETSTVVQAQGKWLLNGRMPVPPGGGLLFGDSAVIQRDTTVPGRSDDFVVVRVRGVRSRIECVTPRQAEACNKPISLRPPVSAKLTDYKYAITALKTALSRNGSWIFAVLSDLSGDVKLSDGLIEGRPQSTNLGSLLAGVDSTIILTICPAVTASSSCEPETPSVLRCQVLQARCSVKGLSDGLYAVHLYRRVQRRGQTVFRTAGSIPGLALVLNAERLKLARSRLDGLEKEMAEWSPPPVGIERRKLVRGLMLALSEEMEP